MRFGLFYEHQLPRPWRTGDEAQLLSDALEQIELADRLGLDCIWLVEHHFLEEYSHSSAPEVFLGAASRRTKQIRLGHGIVHLPVEVNHPAHRNVVQKPWQTPHPPLWGACSRRETTTTSSGGTPPTRACGTSSSATDTSLSIEGAESKVVSLLSRLDPEHQPF